MDKSDKTALQQIKTRNVPIAMNWEKPGPLEKLCNFEYKEKQGQWHHVIFQ
jgi:hypothetical protein